MYCLFSKKVKLSKEVFTLIFIFFSVVREMLYSEKLNGDYMSKLES